MTTGKPGPTGKAGAWAYKQPISRSYSTPGILLISGLIVLLCGCQDNAPLTYTMQDVLAHNDYQKTEPFHRAYDHQVGVIEADLYYDQGSVWVAHDRSELAAQRNLETMYLQPLRLILEENGHIYPEPGSSLALMLDIKNEPDQLLEYILGLVRDYPDLLGSDYPALRLVISGHRPPQEIWSSLPPAILIDGRLSDHIPEALRPKVFMVSSSFSTVVPGEIDPSGLTTQQKMALEKTISEVHRQNLKIRFWGVPDNHHFWMLQNELGVDILGSDHLDEVAQYLRP